MIVSAPEDYLTFDDLSSSSQIVCKASGNPAPRIQWFRDDEIIPEDVDQQIQTTTHGYERTSILTVQLSPSVTGKYTFKASNKNGDVKQHFSLFGELKIWIFMPLT